MKKTISKLLAGLTLCLALAATTQANISYVFSYGHGHQQDTVMTNYDESRDFDYAWGYSAPIVGWSSTPFSYGYLLTVVVDTDYGIGVWYNCAYQTNGAPIDIYIS
jgi:hypothetical protein